MTMSKGILKVCAAAIVLGSVSLNAIGQQQTVFFYTSFKDSMLQRLKGAF